MVVQAVALVAPAASQRQQGMETPRLYRQAKGITAVITVATSRRLILLAAAVGLVPLAVAELHLLLEAAVTVLHQQFLARP
jgi:hypothetical protein